MLYRVGRFLQVVGLLLLPVAIAGNLIPDANKQLAFKTSLLISGVGMVIFYLGWRIQQGGGQG